MVRSRRVPRPGVPVCRPKAARRPARPRHPCAGGRTAGFRPRRVGPAWLRSSPNTSPGPSPGSLSSARSGSRSFPSFGGSVPSGSDSRRRVRRKGMMDTGLTSVNLRRAFPRRCRHFPSEGRRDPQDRPQIGLLGTRCRASMARDQTAELRWRAWRRPAGRRGRPESRRPRWRPAARGTGWWRAGRPPRRTGRRGAV